MKRPWKKFSQLRNLCFFLLIILSGGVAANAQSLNQIESSPDYLWGRGYGRTQSEADKNALAAISNQISVSIENTFKAIEVQDGDNYEGRYENISKTYSSTILTNVKRIIEKEEPDAIVFRYVHKSEIEKVFKSRIDKATEFVRLAERALNDLRLDDALRYYYWSLCLVNSLPRPAEAEAIVGEAPNRRKVLLVSFLPESIERIYSGIKFSCQKEPGSSEYTVLAEYNDAPVRSMDYTYFDGRDYGGIYSIKDGKGIIELRSGYIEKFIKIKLEYEFAGFAVTDKEMQSIFDKMDNRPAFPKIITVPIENEVFKAKTVLPGGNTGSTGAYIDMVLKIAQSVKNFNVAECREYFTADGWADFDKVLSYGSILINENQDLICQKDTMGVVCRGLACNFKFGRGRVFNETLSFVFDSEGKINHVALGVGKSVSEDILKDARWGENSRKKIVSFLEDYRTAYAMQDLDYIERVFADDAVIIVGNKLYVAPELTDKALQEKECVQFTRLSKQEFLDRLQKSFRSKEYINLHFSDMRIEKTSSGDREVYGIQLKQDYYSSNYGDTGYLYLMVDFTDIDKPVIHVRTWQPTPDYSIPGNPIIYGSGNF